MKRKLIVLSLALFTSALVFAHGDEEHETKKRPWWKLWGSTEEMEEHHDQQEGMIKTGMHDNSTMHQEGMMQDQDCPEPKSCPETQKQ